MTIEVHRDLVTPGGASALGTAIVWPRLSGRSVVAGCIAAGVLSASASLDQARFVPFAVPRRFVLSALGFGLTTAAAGSTASVGVYRNTYDSGRDQPGSLLAQASGIDTATTGAKTGTLATQVTLLPGELYWAAITSANSSLSVRGIPAEYLLPVLGYGVGSEWPTTHMRTLWGGGATLDDPAPSGSDLSYGGETPPAIWLIEG